MTATQAHHHRASLKQVRIYRTSDDRSLSVHYSKTSRSKVGTLPKVRSRTRRKVRCHAYRRRRSQLTVQGRVARQSLKTASTQTNAAQLRSNRRNAAKQVQTKKRQSLVSAMRLFSGVDGTPRVVAVVPLCPDVSARETVQALAKALDVDAADCPEEGTWKLKCVAAALCSPLTLTAHQGRALQDKSSICVAAVQEIVRRARRVQGRRLHRPRTLAHDRSGTVGRPAAPHAAGTRTARGSSRLFSASRAHPHRS